MENLQHDYKQVEDTLGEAVLVLDFWRLLQIDPVAEMSLTQLDPSRTIACAGFC
jgi:hypothetical protein